MVLLLLLLGRRGLVVLVGGYDMYISCLLGELGGDGEGDEMVGLPVRTC